MELITCKSIFQRDLTNYFPEDFEVCSLHIQGWNSVGTFSAVNRDFNLDYMVILAKMATNLHFTQKTFLANE